MASLLCIAKVVMISARPNNEEKKCHRGCKGKIYDDIATVKAKPAMGEEYGKN